MSSPHVRPFARLPVHYGVIRSFCVAFFGFTVLVWDHLITLGDEIECIWLRKKNMLVYLFLLNRYFTPLAFIVNLTAYLSDWPPEVSTNFNGTEKKQKFNEVERCKRFVRYEGSCTIIAIEVVALMMFMRIKALYERQWKVIGLVASILVLETATNAWLMTHGEPVQHSGNVHACTMIFDPSLKFLPSLSAWLPLIYDTIVIALTLLKCREPVKQKTASFIIRTLVRDGLLYYSVIFTINIILAIMIVTAPPGIKNITAQLEQLLTVAMMSRITLSLKRPSVVDEDDAAHGNCLPAHAAHWHAPYDGRFSPVLPWRVSIPPSLRSPGHSPTCSAPPPTHARRSSIHKGGLSSDDYDHRPPRAASFAGFSSLPVTRSMANFFSFGDVREAEEQVHVSSIPEHSPLSDRQAYELRSLKASASDHIQVQL
ncbi:hypothetical protein SCHPADRAFT_940778 [Schizopora paradoxa]|uniref:DUF6533 domain-containing protein n=1 Tax=Schizopora paradoxa TaxID=27342 RepID=A0A0H2S823_9AGAM|nr:hypothetical protein SCHPADRAFT_940778 [Schizopora paradoxa]